MQATLQLLQEEREIRKALQEAQDLFFCILLHLLLQAAQQFN